MGVVERPGDGTYRMQPLAVADAADAVLAAAIPAGSRRATGSGTSSGRSP